MTAQEARLNYDNAAGIADRVLAMFERGMASKSAVEMADQNAAQAWDEYLDCKMAESTDWASKGQYVALREQFDADLPAFVEHVP